jgi:uracil-DNA glycosylase
VSFSFDLKGLASRGEIHESWARALQPVQPQLLSLGSFLETEASAGFTILPARIDIMRAFRMPLESVRVLIVGQDPYPTPGHAIGLAFAVDGSVAPLPRSLANIFTELRQDTGNEALPPADLGPWAEEGVMLLNRVLTVRAGEAGSHRGRGWEAVTECAISALTQRKTDDTAVPFVAVLWGKQAATLLPLLGATPVIESAHPSPLSARRGFFGSRPFTRVNEILARDGSPTIDWTARPGSNRDGVSALG